MAKDYFQDIVPPAGDNASARVPVRKIRPIPAPVEHTEEPATSEEYSDDDLSTGETETAPTASRGIRNINMPPRSRAPNNDPYRENSSLGRGVPMRMPRRFSRTWMWVLIAVCVAVLGFLGLFMFRETTVTLTARSQTITFDQSAQFTAYPSEIAATGTLPYTVATTDLTDSEAVQGNGTTATQMKATGSITVYNSYSTASVRLIKNTRFETPTGLIFHIPADVSVPGKVGSTPGHRSVTVVADQAGPQYNVGAIARFTVPGLKTTPAMYAGVYAQSSVAMTGGFSGNRQGVSESARQTAVADIRARLAQKATQYIQSQRSPQVTIFDGLAQITYVDMPDTDAANNQVQISETAHIEFPVFASGVFNTIVAQTTAVIGNDASATLTLIGAKGYSAQSKNLTAPKLGSDAIDFALSGSATFVWSIDTASLAHALAGRDQSVFQTIIGGFTGIEAAHARIEPFWKSSFPSDPSKIKIVVENQASTSARAIK